MTKARILLPFCALLATATAGAQAVRETSFGETAERHLSEHQPYGEWAHDPGLLATDGGDRLETRDVLVDEV